MQIMRRSSAATCEEVMVGTDGLRPIVALLDHTVVPLINKAHAAGKDAVQCVILLGEFFFPLISNILLHDAAHAEISALSTCSSHCYLIAFTHLKNRPFNSAHIC